MCTVLEISKRTYYKYRNTEDKEYYDYLIIKEIFDDSPMESWHELLKKKLCIILLLHPYKNTKKSRK